MKKTAISLCPQDFTDLSKVSVNWCVYVCVCLCVIYITNCKNLITGLLWKKAKEIISWDKEVSFMLKSTKRKRQFPD